MKLQGNMMNQFVRTTEILNTLSGGMIQPEMSLVRMDDHYEVRVRAPGIRSESFQVEIENNILEISALLDIVSLSVSPDPYKLVIKLVVIPFDVDIGKISAVYEYGKLTVILPYNEYASGYHKSVRIKRS